MLDTDSVDPADHGGEGADEKMCLTQGTWRAEALREENYISYCFPEPDCFLSDAWVPSRVPNDKSRQWFCCAGRGHRRGGNVAGMFKQKFTLWFFLSRGILLGL